MGMGGNGNGDDSMGVGREWEQKSHSRTPLTPTLQKTPLYNCLLVLLLHTAAVNKDWGARLRFGGQLPLPLPNVKPRLKIVDFK